MTRPNPGRKGGPHDPVAQNIRNEQMRDAAPSPKEHREKHRKRLAGEGCEVCGEDDPDRLGFVYTYYPPCAAVQLPPDGPDGRVFCDEHRRSNRELWWARRVGQARDHNAVAIAEYACGSVEYATYDPETPRANDPEVTSWDDIPPSHRPIPEVPIRCRCGKLLDEVHVLGGVE